MSEIKEYDWLMKSSQTEEVKAYDGGDAMGQSISEWLGTPEGSVADLPEWGNNLFSFKQEPTGINLQVMAEISIFQKILIDIPNIELRRVGVEFPDIDMAQITIESNTGVFKTTVVL
jgi:phage baseplate assembly protein W